MNEVGSAVNDGAGARVGHAFLAQVLLLLAYRAREELYRVGVMDKGGSGGGAREREHLLPARE